nr:retrovirus-related Pol polyprotein from transposon TNT 1-94 [Tanacetum cinerariifolium]
DFQDSLNDEEDTRSSHEYLNDLEEEYQARAILAKSKRFFKKGTQRFSSAKATDQTECHKYGKKDSSEPSNDNTNVVNALQEPFVVKQDLGKNSSQSPPQINHHCCYGCGDSLEGIFCHKCTYELCENGAHYGYNCPLKVPVVPDLEPFNNQTVDELP